MKTKHVKLLMTALCYSVLVGSGSTTLYGQWYIEGGNTRHRFAQMRVGAELRSLLTTGKTIGLRAPGERGKIDVPGRLTPAIVVGGLHFWGHADFYVSIPLVDLYRAENTSLTKASYASGIRTGARAFPIRLQDGIPAPYLGFDWSIDSYEQSGLDSRTGPALVLQRFNANAGLALLSDFGLIDLGMQYWLPADENYPFSRSEFITVDLPQWALNLAYSYVFDTTIGAEAIELNGERERREKLLADKNELNDWYIGLGVSSAFTLSPSSYNRFERPFVNFAPPPTILPEVTGGFYHNNIDAALQLAFRPIVQEQRAYGLDQHWRRLSLALEAVKFLFDYNGFVPFAGLSLGYEELEFREWDNQEQVTDISDSRLTPAFLFGWDIRPNRLNGFTIRTALRYTPYLGIAMAGDRRVEFNQLEFNFFQFIFYPGR